MNFPTIPITNLDLIQALGLIAGGVWIWSVSLKCDKRLNQVWASNNVLWFIHYAMLGAWVGSLNHLVNVFRSSLYLVTDWRKTRFKWHAMFVLLAAFTAVSIYKYKDITDLLPLYASYTTCIAFFIISGVRGRILLLSGNVAWFAYAIIHSSMGGMLSQVAIVIISLSTINRMRKEDRAEPLPVDADIAGAKT